MVLIHRLKNVLLPEKPEVLFNKQLGENPYYPFKTTPGNRFELELSSRNFYYGTFMALFCLLVIIVWLAMDDPSEYKAIPFIAGVVSASMAWENRGRRKCVLDGNNKEYIYTVNGETGHTGRFHNVYIRLKAQKHGAGDMYYYVVFNGFYVSEQKITSYSKNDKKLRILAKRLAESLDLNYFDVKASSKEHIIRHRPPDEQPEVVDAGNPV